MINRISSHRGSSDRFRRGKKNLPAPTPTPTPTETPVIVASDPTLEIWYDFSDNNTITLGTGTDIVEVNDKSTGTVKPANSTGGKRPKQQTSYQNGLSVSYFDGDNDLFTINPITNFQSLTGTTMIVIGKFNVTGATQTMTQLGTTNAQRNANWLGTTGGKYRVGMGRGLATTTTDVDTNFHIFTSVFDGTQTGNSNRFKFRIDGIERPLTFTQDVSGTTSSDTSVFYIGETADATEDLDGYIGEILLYTKTLNPTEIQNTEQYLKDKWGIVTPTPTPTPEAVSDVIASSLTTSLTNYDNAAVGDFVMVTLSEYSAVVTATSSTKYIMDDTDLTNGTTNWSTNYNVSYNDTTKAIGSIPANNYIIGFAYGVGHNSASTVTTYLREGTTANGTHTKIGSNITYTAITGVRQYYFIRKSPTTPTSNKTYVSNYISNNGTRTVAPSKTNYPIYYSQNIDTNSWSSFTGAYPTLQVIATPNKQW